jgi:hypothetical protein
MKLNVETYQIFYLIYDQDNLTCFEGPSWRVRMVIGFQCYFLFSRVEDTPQNICGIVDYCRISRSEHSHWEVYSYKNSKSVNVG